MRTLVTGGAGFIGSHVAEALVAAGHQVLVVDDLSRGKAESVPHGARLEVVSIATEAVDAPIAAFRPEAVFHHAAQIDVRKSVEDPARDAELNVVGTARVAQAASAAGCRAFVFASTGGAIYGEQDTFPADETHPCRPVSPYGVSKYCAEHYLDYFARASGLRAVHLRYANVYGPRQDPHGEAGVVAIFAQRMLAGDTPTINGDGKQTRDYVYVGDVAAANVKALESDVAGAFNVGTGLETDVNRLAGFIAEAAGFAGEVPHGPAKAGEQRRSVLENRKAAQALGWRPEMPLDAGIARTVDWFRTAG